MSSQKTKYGLGWLPDVPDKRDKKFTFLKAYDLPKSVDLRSKCSAVYDQGQLGSCTANAIAGAVEFDLLKQGLKDFMPSRLFIYYNERVIEGTVSSDAGAMIRDGIKSVNKQGVCDEQEWKYDIAKFTQSPPQKAYKDALNNIALDYARVPRDIPQFKAILASGLPIIIGFSVYSSFESHDMANSGLLKVPGDDETLLGGHAVLVVGYSDDKNSFIVRNSWSKNWGLDGYFYMDYGYITDPNLSDDFWCIKTIK